MVDQLESRRKLLHLSALAIPILYYFVPEYISKPVLLLVTGVFILVEVLRLRLPSLRAFFVDATQSLIRRHELTTLTGSTYLLISSSLCVLFVRKDIAIASISYLILGDTMAAIVGKRYGRVKVFGKTLEGFAACFITCLIIGAVIPGIDFGIALVGALVASLVEILPIPIDDNVRIPLMSAAAMWSLELF
ncbi:hypothetical protein AMJ40_04825 [candidate division TA06 bacterium DG_26]|uniref:Phosphatidate cytidylyltransferase n=1 Tax=candidate division TA06 bacterium DG_26 TaxID=1703771 RepID=A0A0S7WJF7_UNCT6|nr:MAG: hypothetical protein AMJ40_04825 [candidate division TA06 bacterium DG_26]